MATETQQEANEHVWWALNFSLRQAADDAFVTNQYIAFDVLRDQDDLEARMSKLGAAWGKEVLPGERNSSFHRAMSRYYINRAILGECEDVYDEDGNEKFETTPAMHEAADKLFKFEQKFNKFIRKAVRAA